MIFRLSEEQWLNTFGNIFRVEIFGESHGPALGCTLDGLPAGFQPDLEDIVFELSRRRPRQSIESTARREADSFEILSGFFRGRFTGMPLTAVFRNSDAKSTDYCGTAARPSHADYAANRKYGGYNDPRGGGAFSGRLTAPLVFAGAIAKQLLREHGIRVFSHVLRIGNISDLRFEPCMCEQPMLDPFFRLLPRTGAVRLRSCLKRLPLTKQALAESLNVPHCSNPNRHFSANRSLTVLKA